MMTVVGILVRHNKTGILEIFSANENTDESGVESQGAEIQAGTQKIVISAEYWLDWNNEYLYIN